MGGPRPTLRESLRALPPAAWVLFAGTFVNRLGTFVLPFITLYLTTQQHYSIPQAGLAVAMYGIGGFGAQVVGGLLTDRFGRRNVIGFSMLGAAALTLVLWQATTLAVIYPVMLVLAFVAELHRPAAQALITDLVPSEGRVAAFAAFRLAINIGWACGLALGGLLADRSFDYLFVGDAATSAAFGVISLAALPHGTRTSRHEERHLAGATRTIMADRGFLLFLGSILLGGAIYMQNVSTFALHVHDHGYSNAVYGALQALNGAIVVFLELPIAAWTRQRSRTHNGGPGVRADRRRVRVAQRRDGRRGDGRDGVRLDARRDRRVAAGERVRGRPLARAHPRPVPGGPRDDVRARWGDRSGARHAGLRPEPERPLDRVRRRRADLGRTGAGGRTIPRAGPAGEVERPG